jgi:arginine exporter protein ArgO
MNIGFFIVGGIIFAIYMGLTIYNIQYSNRKQREENYPNMKKPKF